MHGEYKTPGGKLVQVDLDVIDGVLRNVMVTGDFFLEPPEALDTIVRAIEGQPVQVSEEELARAIERALAAFDQPVELLGFSPEAVARAVRRAVS